MNRTDIKKSASCTAPGGLNFGSGEFVYQTRDREDQGVAIRISSPVYEPGLPARARQALAWTFTTAWNPADDASPARHYNARRDLNETRRVAALEAWRHGDTNTQAPAALVLAVDRADRYIRRRILSATDARLRGHYQGRFVDYLELDVQSRELLYRAQEAVLAITGSAVLAAGLLDETESGLAMQEWQIARALADLSAHQAGGDTARQAIQSRVGALEHYAHQVALADGELIAREVRLQAETDAEDPSLLDIAAASGVATSQMAQRAQSAEVLAAAAAAARLAR